MFEFDEDSEEYASNQDADQILEDLEEQHAAQEAEEDAVDNVLSNAIERIEEANVWKLLISQDVIEQGSASNRVVRSVNSQLKKFGLNRLEILLGMKTPQVEKPVQIQNQFDQEEAQALRILAAKFMGRSVASVVTNNSQPKLASVAEAPVAQPKLNTVNIPKPSPPPPQPKIKESSPAPVPVQKSKPNKKVLRTKVPEGAVVDKGYAVPNGVKPRSMPTADQQMAALGGAANAPQMNISLGKGMNPNQAMQGANLLNQVISQMAGGHILHTDTNIPDGGDDSNERQ
jgi:hypothetical protein